MSRIVVRNVTRGRELAWRRVKIRKSLDDICHTMELEIPAGERPNVQRHHLIRVDLESPFLTNSAIGGLVATVRVDEVAASADATTLSTMVLGRSPARDIVDSAWTDDALWPVDGEPWTLAAVAGHVARRFGISVAWFPEGSADPTRPVGFFAWQNESPWAKLQAEAAGQGFLLTSNQAGGLYIWRPSGLPRSEGFLLEEGQNVRSIEWRQNGAEQFHVYRVTGYFDEAEVIDPTCPPGRILTIDLTGTDADEEKLRRRALTEMRRRREERVTVTVSGWGLSDPWIRRLGTNERREIFWSPNFFVPVRIPSLNLSRNLLIAEVEHEADARTMRSAITLTRREAYL